MVSQNSIVHIIAALERGGRERQLSIICKYSHAYDNQVLFFYKTEADYITEYGLEAKTTWIGKTGIIPRIMHTIRLCAGYKAKCLVAWGTMETVIALIASVFLGIPMVNFSIRHGIRKKQFSHYFRTFLLHFSKHIVANSVAGLKANNLSKGIVIYNGVEDIPPLLPISEKQARRMQLLGSSEMLVLVTVANLVPYKDFFTVLEALKNIKSKKLDFFYIIIGEGPNRKPIEDIVNDYNLRENILITGRIQNVNEYLAVSDLMIHSTLGEGCSNAILEGMRYGLPIIATKVGGIPEIVNERNALLFEYQDSIELQKNIEMFFADKAMIEKMGRESRRMIQERFTVTTMIENYEKTIRSILDHDTDTINDLIVHPR